MSEVSSATPMTPQERARLRRARIAQNQGDRMALVSGMKSSNFKESEPASMISTEVASSSPSNTNQEIKKNETVTENSSSVVIDEVTEAPVTQQQQQQQTVDTPVRRRVLPANETTTTNSKQNNQPPVAAVAPAPQPAVVPPVVSPTNSASVDPAIEKNTAARMAFFRRRRTVKRAEPIFRYMCFLLFSLLMSFYSFCVEFQLSYAMDIAMLMPLITKHPLGFFLSGIVLIEIISVLLTKIYVGRMPEQLNSSNKANMSDIEAIQDILPKGAASLLDNDQIKKLLPYTKYLTMFTTYKAASTKIFQGLAVTLTFTLFFQACFTILGQFK